MRCVTVECSGATRGAHPQNWTAKGEHGQLFALTSGRLREAVIRYLPEKATQRSDLGVGIEFAFSLPAFLVRADSSKQPLNSENSLAIGARTGFTIPPAHCIELIRISLLSHDL